MSKSVFGKFLKNVIKHWDIKHMDKDERRHDLISELNYHSTK